MPIADSTPKLTVFIEATADALDLLATRVGAGTRPASTELFRACGLLCRRADRLYRIVELDLSAQLSAPLPAAGNDAAVTS